MNNYYDPAKKQEASKRVPLSGPNSRKQSAYADNKKSRNYKYGEDNPEGPNWDKLSKNADGDTGQNAGVFK